MFRVQQKLRGENCSRARPSNGSVREKEAENSLSLSLSLSLSPHARARGQINPTREKSKTRQTVFFLVSYLLETKIALISSALAVKHVFLADDSPIFSSVFPQT